MSNKYIICAEIDATYDMPGVFAQDWFDCGINDKSERYPSADAALMAARAAYKGPNADGIECRAWAKRATPDEAQAEMLRESPESHGYRSSLDWRHYGRYQFKDLSP